MTKIKFRKVLSLVLAFVMTASLFSNWPMPAFATDGTDSIILDFVPENGVRDDPVALDKTGTIRNNSIELYKSFDYGAEGVEVSGVQGLIVDVLQSYTIGGVTVYRCDYLNEEENKGLYDSIFNYPFISSTDIMLEGEESLPAPTPYPAIIPSKVINEAYNSLLATTTSADYDSTYGGISAEVISLFSAEQKAAVELHKSVLVAYETLMATETVASYDSIYYTLDPEVIAAFTEAQNSAVSAHREELYAAENPDTGIYLELPQNAIAQADAPSGALASINGTSLIAYKSLDNGAMGVEISVDAGTVIELITKYTFDVDGSQLVFYRYDYTGTNETLKNEAYGDSSGHVFIAADSVTITNEVGTNSYTNEEFGITVSGQIPTGLTLKVAPEDADDILAGSGALMGGGEWTYDVDLTYPGGEYKTTQGIDVTFEKENVQFPAGTQYKAYHIKADNSVEVLGPFTYDGNDIALTFNGLSPVGLSADAENINTRPFEKAIFKYSEVKVYPSDKNNAEPVTLTGLTADDVFKLANNEPYGYIMSDGTTRYYIEWYLGSNSSIAGILNVGSRYLVDINDIEEYIESTPTPTPTPTPEPEQPEEVVNAYENLIKAPTLDDFYTMLDESEISGTMDSFTDEQWDKIDEVETILIEMDAATEDLTDFGFEGTVTVEGAKLYLNPITWPDEYVVVSTIMVESVEVEGILAELAAVEGDYSDEYYIIDTSSWAAFQGKTPYKYIHKNEFAFEGNWAKVNGKGYFLSDEIKIYDNTGKTYRRITDGLSKGAFDVLYSFFTDNGDGTVTDWYVINTTGWTDVNGSTFKNRLVKRSDVNLITAEAINTAYNNILGAATVNEFDSLYSAAQTNGIIDCLTDAQKQALADTRTVLAGMAEATTDLSQYELPATFANEETKLYPNPVTQPDTYITAVVKEEQPLLANLLSVFPLFLTAHAAEEEVTAQEIIITGKYLADDGTLYYILDVSGWEGLDGIEIIYVKASEIDIYVDEATQITFIDLLSAQSGEELAEMLAELDGNTVAVMTEAGLVDLAENHAEVLEFLAENGSTPVSDDSVVGLYAQPIEGTETVFLYANPNQFTDGMTYYDLPSDEFKTIFKIVEVTTNEFGEAVYYKINRTYPAKDGAEPCSWIRADAVEILEDYVDPAETLYLKLMQTETLEEWFELIESLTDEQLQLFDEMDETMSTELEEHVDSLTSAIDKAKTDTLSALLSSTTVEEYISIRKTVTEDIETLFSGTDYIALHDHITALADAEDTSPEGVVDYTYSAPLVVPDYTEIQEATVYNMKNRMLMAAAADESEPTPAPEGTDTTNPAIKDTDGVVTSKTVTANGDGTYTVNLETYVTGAKVTTAVEKQIPTDIIIVVDQSGSMEFDMNKSTTYDRINGTAEEIYNTDKYADKVYVNVGTTASPVYKKVTMTAETADTYVPASTLYDTNSELRNFVNNGGDLYYKATETSTPAEVTIKRSDPDDYRQRTYTYTATGLNESSYGNNATPSFLDKLYIKTDAITKVTFSYKDANDQTVTKEYLPTDSVPKDSDNIVGNTYYYQNVSTSEYRLDALVRALNNFAASVEEKAKGNDGVWGPNPAKENVNDDVNHRIAIVGFSSSVGTYRNTEILTGCNISTGSSHNNEYGVYYPLGVEKNGVMYNSTDYAAATGTALVSMDTTAGQTSVENAIKALTAHGGTQTDHGLDMAADILAAEAAKGTEYTKVVNGVTTTVRNKIVILFTDGSPTSSSGFETSVANSAIGYAKTIKNTHNATLYGVGIFDNADARVLTNNDKTNAYLPTGLSNENKFMHFVSSNFKNAENMSTGYDTNNGTYYNTETFHQDSSGKYTGRSYYLSASNSDALNNIFQTISEESVTNANVVELDETTVIKDIVAPNFSVPANASNVTVKVDEVDTTTGAFKNNPQSVSGVTASIDGTDVNVTGFDFAENWVGSETAANGTVTYRGKKLIITFDVPVDPDFMGGNKVKTNGNNSGVYTKDGTLVENFARPTQDIALSTIDVVWRNQNIYRTNNANIEKLFLAATVNGKSAAQVINGENNAYVDIVFTITGPDGELAKYTVPAGKAFAEGGWNDKSKLTPALTEDTEYKLSWTVTPIYEGSVKGNGGSREATVFVYEPVVTYKDSTAYYGGTVEINDTDNSADANAGDANIVSTVWKHGTTLSTTVTMEGSIPTIEPAYEFVSGVSNGVVITKNDVPVNVTTTVKGDTTETNIVDFVHNPCEEGETIPSGAEFVLHIETAQLTISKTVDANGADTIPNDSFAFEISMVWSSEFPAGVKHLYTYSIYNVGSDTPVKTDAIYSGAKGIELKHNQYIVLKGLPLGEYTVTETTSDKYTTTSTGATGKLTKDALAATAKFTNTLNTGDLTVTKEVIMPSGYAQTGEDFRFQVKQGDTVVETFSISNGESYTVKDLVQGEYTVVEEMTEDQAKIYTADKPTQIVKVEAGKTATAKVTNTAGKGNLSVAKTVVDKADNYDSTNETFTVKVKVDGYTNATLPYKIGGTAQTPATVTDGYVTITLKGGQTAVFSDLLVGKTYEVTEELSETQQKYFTAAYDGNETGTIVAGQTKATTITNTEKAGIIVVAKEVIMPSGFAQTNEDFEFQVKQGDTVIETITISNGDSYTVDRLAPGDYTVVENLTTAQTNMYTADKPSQDVTVEADETANVKVVNTALTGNFSVTKAIVDNAVNYTPSADEEFEFVVTVDGYAANTALPFTVNGVTNYTSADGKFLLKADEVAVFENLLTGKAFTVAEILSDDQEAIYSQSVVSADSGNESAKVYTIETNATEQVTVTNTVKTGDLTVTKDVVAENVDVTKELFAFTVKDANGNLLENGSFNLGDNGSKTFENLLVGSYTVEEAEYDKYETTVDDTSGNKKTVAVAEEDVTVKFVNTLVKTELTISKTVTGSGTTYNVKDSFIFNVYRNGEFFTTIALQAGESVTIPDAAVDDIFTVIEDTSWSWRYNNKTKDSAGNITDTIQKNIVADKSQNTFDFTNELPDTLYWLDNESHCENLWNNNGFTTDRT